MLAKLDHNSNALNQLCLSRNFSIRTENAAKPAQPAQAAFGPPRNTQKKTIKMLHGKKMKRM